MTTRSIRCEWLGLKDFHDVHQYQLELVETARHRDWDVMLLCSHPPVVTLGKQASNQDIISWTGPTYPVERGGKATYHGPMQLIAYPILDLRYYAHDLGGYLRALEKSIIEFCHSYQLQARGNPSYAGVWIKDPTDAQEKKLASIGIAVRRWVTYHGLAINLERDSRAFEGILSCGMDSTCMTSLDQILPTSLTRNDIEQKICMHLLESLSQLSQSCQALGDGRQ